MPRLQNNTEFTVQAYMIAHNNYLPLYHQLNSLYKLAQEHQQFKHGQEGTSQDLNSKLTLDQLQKNLKRNSTFKQAINDLTTSDATVFTNQSTIQDIIDHYSNSAERRLSFKQRLRNTYSTKLQNHLRDSNPNLTEEALTKSYVLDENVIGNSQAYHATPLHIACSHGEADLAEKLLDKGASYEQTDSRGYTPIQLAAIAGEQAQAIWNQGLDDPSSYRNYRKLLESIEKTPQTQYDAKKAKRGDKTKDGANLAHLIAQHGTQDILNKFIDKYPGLFNKSDKKNKRYVEHYAALNTKHRDECLQALYNNLHNFKINRQDAQGDTPLHLAITHPHEDKTKRNEEIQNVINLGANPNIQNKLGNNAFHLAAKHSNFEVFNQLYKQVSHGILNTAKAAKKNNKYKQNILHLAATNKRHGESLLDYFIDGQIVDSNQINDRDTNGKTPLLTAIENGNTQAAHKLVEQGANVNKTDKNGNTPLHLAVRYGQADTVKQLIDQGAKVKTNDLGNTPLHILAKGGNEAVFQELLINEQRYDFKDQLMNAGQQVNNNNCNVLHLAATNSQTGNAFIKEIPGYKDQILNASDDFGQTPLHRALLANNLQAAETLLRYGAKADKKDNNGITPVHLIAQKGSSELFKLATQNYSKNLTQFDNNNRNILHYVASNPSSSDCAQIIQQIIKQTNKTNYITKPDNNGVTPIHKAARIGNNQALKSLAHQISETKYPIQTAKKLLQPTDHYNTLTIAARKCDRTSLQTITDYINKLGQQKDLHLQPIYHEALAQAAFYKNPDAIRFLKDHSQAPAIADLEQYKTDRKNFLDHYQPGYCFKNSRKTEYKLNLRNFAIHAYILGVQKADDNLEEALGELNELNDTITHSEHIDNNLKQQLTKHYVQPLLQTCLKKCIVQNDLDKAGELYKNYTDLVENNQSFILQLCEQAYGLRAAPFDDKKPPREFFEQLIEQDNDWPQTIKAQIEKIKQRAQQTLEAQSDNLNTQQKSDPLRNELKTSFQQQNDTDPLQINQVWINDDDQAMSFEDDKQSFESKLANYDQKIDSITYEVQRRSEGEHKEQPPSTTITEIFVNNQRQSKRYYSFDKDIDSIKNGILFAQSKGKTRLGIQNIAKDTLTDEEHQALQQDLQNRKLPPKLTYQDAAYLTIKQAKLTVSQEKELNLSQGVKEIFHPPQQSPDNNKAQQQHNANDQMPEGLGPKPNN